MALAGQGASTVPGDRCCTALHRHSSLPAHDEEPQPGKRQGEEGPCEGNVGATCRMSSTEARLGVFMPDPLLRILAMRDSLALR